MTVEEAGKVVSPEYSPLLSIAHLRVSEDITRKKPKYLEVGRHRQFRK
jgi:hypothetical protein